MDSIDDERPPPIVKLAHAHHQAQFLATFFMDKTLENTHAYIMKLEVISQKLNKIFVINLKWQHQLMREICIIVNTFENIFILYIVCDKISNLCFHEVPCYYENEVQFCHIIEYVTPS